MTAETIGRAAGRQWGRLSRIGKLAVIVCSTGLLAFCLYIPPHEKIQAAVPPLPPPKSAEQVAWEAKKEHAFQATARAAATIKSAMRDPDSLVWESIHTNDDATVMCFEYRARNGFGGMNREFAVIAQGRMSQKPAAWNKHCVKPLINMDYVKHALR